jgi:hypothetical protein
MKEIGLILGVHESRVSQIHSSAVLHLRARLTSPTPPKKLPKRHQGTKRLRNKVRPKSSGTTPIPPSV